LYVVIVGNSKVQPLPCMHARHIPEDLLLGILDFFIEKHEVLDIVSGFLDGVRT
jgi:hypothetical protein